VGVAQEKAQAFQGKKIDGQFLFTRDKTVYVNHYYFYIDDADFSPLFLKVCSYAPWATKAPRKNNLSSVVVTATLPAAANAGFFPHSSGSPPILMGY
jgi:hypothetical protein